MTNQERIKDYLVGKKGYLKSDISNGKVIMLSGKWGSGKTHFWKEILAKELQDFQIKKQKTYVYSSLYGNNSIEKLEDNIYAQSYLCSIGGKNIVTSGYEKVRDFGKRFGSFCSLLDVSKLVDGIDDVQQKNIKKSALSYIENGGLICFDDFERKSKDIDLNDLFGLISHFAIDLNCKVVIILNDDVFEGKEKNIFSNVKEKTVSKFLKYEPSIEELFNLVFNNENKYEELNEYRELILKTIEITKELNARIYIQVLDNLLEWIKKSTKTEKIEEVLKYLILVNINFILYHTIYEEIEKYPYLTPKDFYLFIDNKHINSAIISSIQKTINAKFFLHELKRVFNSNLNLSSEKESSLRIIEENESILSSVFFLEKHMRKIPREKFISEINEINYFIETGILIKENN